MPQPLDYSAVLIAPTLALDPGLRTLIWSGVLIGVVVAAVAGVLLLRRKITAPDSPMSGVPSIGLEELRRMRDRGQITEEEFQQARNRVIRKASARLAADKAQGADGASGPAPASPPLGRPGPQPSQLPSRRPPAPRVHKPSTPGAGSSTPAERPRERYPTDNPEGPFQ